MDAVPLNVPRDPISAIAGYFPALVDTVPRSTGGAIPERTPGRTPFVFDPAVGRYVRRGTRR